MENALDWNDLLLLRKFKLIRIGSHTKIECTSCIHSVLSFPFRAFCVIEFLSKRFQFRKLTTSVGIPFAVQFSCPPVFWCLFAVHFKLDINCWATQPQQRFYLVVVFCFIAIQVHANGKYLATKRQTKYLLIWWQHVVWNAICCICVALFSCLFFVLYAFCVFTVRMRWTRQHAKAKKPNTFKLRWHFVCGQCFIVIWHCVNTQKHWHHATNSITILWVHLHLLWFFFSYNVHSFFQYETAVWFKGVN